MLASGLRGPELFFRGPQIFFFGLRKKIKGIFFLARGSATPYPEKRFLGIFCSGRGVSPDIPSLRLPGIQILGLPPTQKKKSRDFFSEEGVGHPLLRKKKFCGPWAGARLSPVPGPGWACPWSKLGPCLVQVGPVPGPGWARAWSRLGPGLVQVGPGPGPGAILEEKKITTIPRWNWAKNMGLGK